LWNAPEKPGTTTNEKPVPLYGDPGSIEPPGGAARSNDEENSTPFSKMSGQTDDAATASVQHADGAQNPDPFQKPVTLDPESAHRSPEGLLIPYGYDQNEYRWLRGVVDYDETDKSWHILYAPKPAREDKFGGAIRLLPHQALDTLHAGDVVKIQGEVDYDSRETATGKPQYRIAELGRYKPASGPVAN
jgi:hypothetical protein